MTDEAARYLDTAKAAKDTAIVAALALINCDGDAEKAISNLEDVRPATADAAFAGDVVSLAQQAIREARERASGGRQA